MHRSREMKNDINRIFSEDQIQGVGITYITGYKLRSDIGNSLDTLEHIQLSITKIIQNNYFMTLLNQCNCCAAPNEAQSTGN